MGFAFGCSAFFSVQFPFTSSNFLRRFWSRCSLKNLKSTGQESSNNFGRVVSSSQNIHRNRFRIAAARVFEDIDKFVIRRWHI